MSVPRESLSRKESAENYLRTTEEDVPAPVIGIWNDGKLKQISNSSLLHELLLIRFKDERKIY
jgi:hypothetical protein